MADLSLRMRFAVACIIAAAMWGVGLLAWRMTGEVAPLVFFGYLGTVLAPGVVYYLGLPGHRRLKGRRVLTLRLALSMFSAALAIIDFTRACICACFPAPASSARAASTSAPMAG